MVEFQLEAYPKMDSTMKEKNRNSTNSLIFFKASLCLQVHNVRLNLTLPILEQPSGCTNSR